MQCTSTRQFERKELCSPKRSGVCKLLVRTERRSSSALNAAHDDKQSISLMYNPGCLLNCNLASDTGVNIQPEILDNIGLLL